MSEAILFECSESGIGVITFNRPAVRNALNPEAMHRLAAVITQARQMPDLRVLLLTGAGGKAFISGGDVRELNDDMSENSGLRQHDLMVNTLTQMEMLPVPVIAALEGGTRGGGCEVALACDLRIAAEDATLGFAQIKMGVTPGWGGAQRLFNLVGYARAMDLLLTGRTLTAHEALAMGLVNQLSPPGEALGAALSLAEDIVSRPGLAVCGIKEVLRGYLDLPAQKARTHERAVFGRLWASADHVEASAAFLEKRPPDFRGK